MTNQNLSRKEAARLRGGIPGGREVAIGEFPWQAKTRIVDGKETDINEYPWQP